MLSILWSDCAVNAEKYSDRSSDVRTERSEGPMMSFSPNIFQHWPSNRLIRALSYDNHIKAKFVDWIGKEPLTDPNMGEYCPGNNQSDFEISGSRPLLFKSLYNDMM